jgi:HEAT repeat protein/flagellin-specific chaperone FliS
MKIFFRLSVFVMFTGICFIPLSVFPDTESLKSIDEERREKLAFGIDNEVIELIDTLIQEKNDTFTPELVSLYQITLNDLVKTKIVQYLSDLEIDGHTDMVFEDLQDKWDQVPSTDLMLRYIGYLRKYQTDEITSFFASSLIPEQSERISMAAISAVGASGNPDYTDLLLSELEARDLSVNKRSELISALGLLGDKGSVEMLLELLLDNTEEKSVRWRAATALGDIGGGESFSGLLEVFNSDDPLLRTRATEALGKFDGKEAEDALILALRDSFWRVRVAAAAALGNQKSTNALDILIYKASSDPDIRNVRTASIQAIGKIGTRKAGDFLEELYLNEKALLPVRIEALKALMEADNRKALAAIRSLFNDDIGEQQSAIVSETAKYLATAQEENLEEVYERMLEMTSQRELVLYALRGIRINRFTSLKAKVQALSEEGSDSIIRRNALSTFEALQEED